MNCRKAINEISNYLNGDLDDELRQTIQAHLDGCHHCHAVFDTTKKTIQLYCDGKLFELPNGVRQRLHEALRRKLQHT